jgi:DNA-binding protein HU-beta
MNKKDIVDRIADQQGLSKEDAARLIDAVFDTISSALKNGEEVKLKGFGSFSIVRRARTSRNPVTGPMVQVSPTRRARFVAGRSLTQALGGPHGDGTDDDV